MIKEAIDKILSLTPVQIHELNGETYATDALHLIRKRGQEPPRALEFVTLTGLTDFIKLSPDSWSFDDGNIICHITNFDQVQVKGDLQANNANVRFTYAVAKINFDGYRFGHYYDLESFMVAIQSQFIADETTEKLLAVIGNLANEHVQTSRDDGVTQSVQVKTGITTKSNISIENPLELRPFRTFAEVPQPKSSFIFRIKEAGGQLVCALFESDGGNWKLAAIENIKLWLKGQELNDILVVG